MGFSLVRRDRLKTLIGIETTVQPTGAGSHA